MKDIKIPLSAILAFALLNTIIVCLPYPFLAHFQSDAPHFAEGRPSMVKIDELHYAARIREVMDGNPRPTDVQLREHKSDPGVRGLLPVWIAGWIAKVSNSIVTPFLFFDIVMPFFTFLLLYGFLFRLSKNPILSLAKSFVIFFYFDHQFFFLTPYFDRPLIEMERFPSPQFHFPLLLGYLWFLLKCYEKPSRKNAIIVGIFLAALVYSYVYYAVFGVCLLMLTGAYALFYKRRAAYKELFIACLVFAGLCLPYILMFLQARALALEEIMERFGIYHGHYLYKKHTLNFAFMACLFYFLIKEKQFKDHLLFGAMVLSLCLFNQQLVTGSNLHPMHWLIRLLQPLVLIQLVNLIGEALQGNVRYCSEKFSKGLLVISLVSATLVIGLNLSKQIWYATQAQPATESEVSERQVLDWLVSQPAETSVVLSTDFAASKRLLIHTPHDVYLPHFAGTLASDLEIEERLAVLGVLLGVSEKEWFELLASDYGKKLLRFCFGNRFYFELHRERQQDYEHTDEVLEQIKREPRFYLPVKSLKRMRKLYQEAKALSVKDLLEKYQLDYLLVHHKLWDLVAEQNIRFPVAFSNEHYTLYKI